MSGLSEQQLIERCRHGDDEAFRELVDQQKRLVFGLIGRSVSNHARVEELAQEVFLRVYRGLPHFRRESKISTWVFRIVANVLAEERKPGLTAISLDDPQPERDSPPIDPGVVDRAYQDFELRDRLEKAIERLPLPYQMLVNGHYLEGLRYEDLASALNLPMGTVKTHLHRAKRLLRQLLETELGASS
jgi:RNA polymerase sigma-70 factor (ECF subfamily)